MTCRNGGSSLFRQVNEAGIGTGLDRKDRPTGQKVEGFWVSGVIAERSHFGCGTGRCYGKEGLETQQGRKDMKLEL